MQETDIPADEVMSYKGLAAYLKLSPGTLRQKVMDKKIPFFKIDGSVRFYKKAIDAWIKEKHKSVKRIQPENNGELFPVDGGIANEQIEMNYGGCND